MRFWKNWALWQKLSIVLAILITIVLIYSFAILIRNRRKTKKHAEAEESEKAERDAELHPMVTNSSDIPFGARALERGVQVDGIWVSNNTTPVLSPQPSAPARSQAPSQTCDSPLKEATTNTTSISHVTESDHGTSIDEPMVPETPAPPINTPVSETPSGLEIKIDRPINNRPQHPRHNLSHVDQYPNLVATPRNEPQKSNEPDMNPIKKFARNSWITKSPDSPKRKSIAEDPAARRRSSEEFRRRMSKLFDDNVQMHGTDSFKLNLAHRTPGYDRRQSNLGPPPPS